MAQAADTSLMEAGWIGAQTRGGCRRRCGHTRGVDGGRAGGQRTGFRGLVGYEGMDALGTWACLLQTEVWTDRGVDGGGVVGYEGMDAWGTWACQQVIACPQTCRPLRAREGRA